MIQVALVQPSYPIIFSMGNASGTSLSQVRSDDLVQIQSKLWAFSWVILIRLTCLLLKIKKDNCKGAWKAICGKKLCIFENFHIHKKKFLLGFLIQADSKTKFSVFLDFNCILILGNEVYTSLANSHLSFTYSLMHLHHKSCSLDSRVQTLGFLSSFFRLSQLHEISISNA